MRSSVALVRSQQQRGGHGFSGAETYLLAFVIPSEEHRPLVHDVQSRGICIFSPQSPHLDAFRTKAGPRLRNTIRPAHRITSLYFARNGILTGLLCGTTQVVPPANMRIANA
jgi:hypothetical protein